MRRIVLASGKIAVEAQTERDVRGAPVAIARIEQLYPWPYEGVARLLERYPNARELWWLQEEPENMGAWNHIKGRMYEAHEDTHAIHRVSRPESASPATGSSGAHHAEVRGLWDHTFGGLD